MAISQDNRRLTRDRASLLEPQARPMPQDRASAYDRLTKLVLGIWPARPIIGGGIITPTPRTS
jgi:hypothetical protein